MMITHLGISQLVDEPEVRQFSTNQGARIFQLPLEAFPGFWVYAYLALVGDLRVLIDTGSGFGVSNQHLQAKLETAGELIGEPLSLAELTHVLITHGHIDHFGGLPFIRANSRAQVGVHELDLRQLTNVEERLTIISRRLAAFLSEAGVPAELRQPMVQMYQHIKLDYTSTPVDFTYEAAGMKVGPFELLHTPGHCAGQVVIRLHDVLFSGDHVLSEISPHQAPERLALHTGLSHYLESLDRLNGWCDGIRLTLGGHNPPIERLPRRISEIKQIHRQRLDQILVLLVKPHTIAEISRSLFGEVHGYNTLLALEEAGAHIEYLCQRGLLGIANLTEVIADPGLPIRYQTLENSRINVTS